MTTITIDNFRRNKQFGWAYSTGLPFTTPMYTGTIKQVKAQIAKDAEYQRLTNTPFMPVQVAWFYNSKRIDVVNGGVGQYYFDQFLRVLAPLTTGRIVITVY